MMTSGHDVISRPVPTASYPNVLTSRNGIATMPSICAVNDIMLVATDVVKMGILSRSNGSMG